MYVLERMPVSDCNESGEGTSWRSGGRLLLALGLGLTAHAPQVRAQAAIGVAAQGPSHATALPLSGRSAQNGAVQAQQVASPSGGTNTISSSIQVTGNFSGSVPGAPDADLAKLTLADALKLGLKNNLGTISSNNSVRAARAQRLQELSALLPNIAANASETVTQVNLAAYGFQFKLPPGLNFSIPSVVGQLASPYMIRCSAATGRRARRRNVRRHFRRKTPGNSWCWLLAVRISKQRQRRQV